MLASPPAEAMETPPRARRHVAWVLALARWLKGWAERVLAEHAAAKAAVQLEGATVRSLPLREQSVLLLPVPPWLMRPLEPPFSEPQAPLAEALTPRLNSLRCIPKEGTVPEGGSETVSLPAAPRVPFGFDPTDLLPAEPLVVVAPPPSAAQLLQAAAMEVPDPPPVAPPSLRVVTSLPRDPARDLLSLLREAEGTLARPSVPWSETDAPASDEPSDAAEMLRQCERLELEPTVE